MVEQRPKQHRREKASGLKDCSQIQPGKRRLGPGIFRIVNLQGLIAGGNRTRENLVSATPQHPDPISRSTGEHAGRRLRVVRAEVRFRETDEIGFLQLLVKQETHIGVGILL